MYHKLKKYKKYIPSASVLVALVVIPALLSTLYHSKRPGTVSTSHINQGFEQQTIVSSLEDASATKDANTPVENIPEESKSAQDTPLGEQGEAPTEKQKEAEEVPSLPSNDLTIGLFADAQAGKQHGYWYVPSAVKALSQNARPDMVIDLGDFIESRVDRKKISKNEAISDFNRLSGNIKRYYPLYHVIGNHEVFSLSHDDLEKLTGRNNYYSFKTNGYNIIILDTNYTEKEKLIDVKHEKDFIYDGTVNDKQLDWLKRQLSGNKNNLIFSHHPLYELTNEDDIVKVLKKNRDSVLGIFHGHIHPDSLRIRDVSGFTTYTIPSLFFQKTYAIVSINGKNVKVTARRF